MSLGDATFLLRQGVFQVLRIAAPPLIAAVVVGLIIAILMATTSIQEQTLTFVPKIFTILLIVAFLGGWMFVNMREYTIDLFSRIQYMAH